MIGGLSPWHLLFIVVAVAIVFGGKGKLSSVMGDAAKGIKAFKDGLKHEDEPAASASPAGALTSDVALRDAQDREQAAREILARETAAREAAERRARETAA